MRRNIMQFLRSRSGEYISGEEISRQLKVSRTAIWKHIQALRQEGYRIESHPRLGYCLREIPDRLLPDEIGMKLTTKILGKQIHYFTDVHSTNNEAKRIAMADAPEGTIVVAEAQNRGRGRMSRGWFSPFAKGIWFSVILRPPFSPAEAPKCTLMAAVAVSSAIQQVTGVACGIKWPNDILYQGKKIVGILTEMSAEIDVINYIVIGIGINVNIGQEEFPAEISGLSTSLAIEAGRKISRLDLLTAILQQLESLYTGVLANGFASVLGEWRSHSITLGQNVEVLGGTGNFTGIAVDIDNDGALLIQTGSGVEKVLAGDVSIRPRTVERR
ncbi:transcriptional repressor c-terminal [Lucifera butyrica]|uniref:Bifunctional ligase/repressor BirA n=1 Tax=Lucifera butyrica TaxID=1351585 RepID=A0A498R4P4_9FIRM|nr:biotin--[acetyl-CoA-carboxylase] ligase [Lucifera butyrica]VBB06414.1 transcriptional repressor c-terminal [Lucifera butyrica]